jgi:hypothetical protein
VSHHQLVGALTNRGPIDKAAPDGRPQPRSRSQAGWPWIVVGIGVAVVKGSALNVLAHHTWGWIALFSLAATWSLLRAKPVATAFLAAPAVAILLAPHSLLLGITVGFGTLAALIAMFIAIGTLLRLGDYRV